MLYKITLYVPLSHKEDVKNALFEAGAGRYKNYDHCSWEVVGEGEFRALKGSNPYIGSQDCIEYVDEARIEMICEKLYLEDVVKALITSHPYEEPAYDIVQIYTINTLP